MSFISLPSTAASSSSSSSSSSLTYTSVSILVNRYTHTESDTDIITITMNNPRTGNAMNKQAYNDIAYTVNEADQDPRVGIIVLLGSGKFFSTGADLTEPVDPELQSFTLYTNALMNCSKILIAGVNGPAIGILCTTLSHCDLVYCTNNATFTVPFLRIAVVPEFASSYTFPQTLGNAVANDCMYTGRTLSANEAAQFGLVSAMIPSSSSTELLLFIETKIHTMLKPAYAKKSLLLFKKLLKASFQQNVQQAHSIEKQYLQERLRSTEPMEAALQWMLMKDQRKNNHQNTPTSSLLPKL